jgi:putative ABC transport system ATP-binding protein
MHAVAALRDVSMTFEPRLLTALMGPSGSGKSTLLHVVGALDAPTAGRIDVDGEELTSISARRRAAFRSERVGFVFQRLNLVPHFTARQNVELPLLLSGLSFAAARDRSLQQLDRMGLGPRADHRPSELSGGECQRVAVARAIIRDPDIVLADEPTGELDTENGRTIMQLVRGMRTEHRLILIATHDPEVGSTADAIVEMRNGQIGTSDGCKTTGGRP